ncbi:hypothetical protein LTR95_010358 [Oleoguttula sp. CCFEE 5521]
MAQTNGSNGSSSSPSSPPPVGIYVPVPTFFMDATSSSQAAPPLDIETQSAHSLFLARAGIRGLVILGSTGEAIHITPSERRELLKSQRKALDDAGFKDRPIIAGTTAQSISEALEQISASKDAGAEYAMVLSPGYFASNVNQQGLIQWFETVANESVLPIMVYHYPGVTNGLYISPATFESLAAHPKIVGCKLSHGIIDDTTLIAANPKIDHDGFVVFTGLGQNLLPVLAIGGVGAIDGLAGCFPRVVVKLYDLFNSSLKKGVTSKELAEMRELQYRICEGEKVVARWGVVGMKEAIARVWQMGGAKGARLPLAGGFEEGEQEWKKWEPVFTGLKELEQKLEKDAK